jgi:AcrR family transcriptional regulator
VQLILSGGVEAVSMETVADRAGVSRPLVYKHFASKNELLTGVYRREALTIGSWKWQVRLSQFYGL